MAVKLQMFDGKTCHVWHLLEHVFLSHRAENNGRSMDNVRPDRGLDQSKSGLAGHFDRSVLDTNILFSIQLSLNALEH